MDDVDGLINENSSLKEECNLCRESKLKVGNKTPYGGVIVFQVGEVENGWFAALSPRTGGLDKDFTVQLMPFKHLTHFCQVGNNLELAKNYGIAFAKVSKAMTKIMGEEEPDFKITADTRDKSLSVASYGKCTNWEEKKEHLHIKVFPFRGDIGQPHTVDSSFGRKDIFNDKEMGKEFVKMKPVRKKNLSKKRFEELSKKLIDLLR